jgi:ribosomal protein S18 acetylase RimI-like enzyme
MSKLQCKHLSVEDLKDVVAFVGNHPSGGMSPDDAHRIITGLVRGPEAVMDLHDEAGRLAVAAVVDTCANLDDSVDMAVLGIRGQQLPQAGFQLLFDQAEEVTRQGPKGSLDITLMPERTSWELPLRARGYEPAYMQYRMECPGDAPLPPLRKPLPEAWRWMDAEDDLLADYHRVLSEAFSTVPGTFVPPLEEMVVALKRAGRRPRVLVEGRRVRAFATVRVHERPEGTVGEVRTIGRDPTLRGAGLGEHALQQALALLRQAAPIVKFELEVTARNEAALKLYQRHGFQIVQRMPVFRRRLPRQG